jgi:uncharacterized protein (TIGR02444 family)
MTDTDTQNGSPFWRFSLRFYRAPGVADACIALQDGCGVDVNVLLFVLWLAGERRQIGVAEACRIDMTAMPWRDGVVVPLRALRRQLKDGVPPIGHDEVFRNRVKAIELEAERLEQEALFGIVPSLAATTASSAQAAARANMAAYEAALEVRLPPATLDVLYAALLCDRTAARSDDID